MDNKILVWIFQIIRMNIYCCSFTKKQVVGFAKNFVYFIHFFLYPFIVDNLLIDTGVETTGDLETLMLDRMVWKRVIQDPRAATIDPP